MKIPAFTKAHWKNLRWRQALLMHVMDLPLYLRRALFSGNRRFCPICESHLKVFLPHGIIMRKNARCAICGSLERHRLTWIFVQKRELLFGKATRLLHMAPDEGLLGLRFKSLAQVEYVSADLRDPNAMVKADITNMPFANGEFDAICCNHVLEHIPDDKKAISELFRVLRPGGWAVIQVPLSSGRTHEDIRVTNPFERERHFGQHDHVRAYGPDIRDRLEFAGFCTQPVRDDEICSPQERERLGLTFGETIFFCQKTVKTHGEKTR